MEIEIFIKNVKEKLDNNQYTSKEEIAFDLNNLENIIRSNQYPGSKIEGRQLCGVLADELGKK